MQSHTTPAPHDRQMPVVAPRAMREPDAAAYVGFSASYLRNTRVADMRKVAAGGAIDGPRWIHVGTAVRYLREDLDAWLDAFRREAAAAGSRRGG